MKNIIQLMILLLLISLKTGYSFSQLEGYNIIRISRISYKQKDLGKVKKQLKIDLENKKLFYRENLNREFKEFQTTQNISLFTDSLKIARIKEISKLISVRDEECLYHNEFGYFKIELIKLNWEDEIYGEIFLLNNPYECKDDNDQILVRAYYDLIIELFKENK